MGDRCYGTWQFFPGDWAAALEIVGDYGDEGYPGQRSQDEVNYGGLSQGDELRAAGIAFVFTHGGGGDYGDGVLAWSPDWKGTHKVRERDATGAYVDRQMPGAELAMIETSGGQAFVNLATAVAASDGDHKAAARLKMLAEEWDTVELLDRSMVSAWDEPIGH